MVGGGGGGNQPIFVIESRVKVLVDTLGLAINPIACCCSARADDFAHTRGKSNTDLELLTHVHLWKI